MYGVGFQSDSRKLSWKVWEIFVVVAEGDLGLCVDLCGCCRLRPLCVGQTGKGGWVCGRKAGGRERHRALPWVAQFLPEEVSFPTFHFFFPPILHLKSEVTLCLGPEQSTWPHDPVTPSSPTRGPGELPAEGAASSRGASAARTAR